MAAFLILITEHTHLTVVAGWIVGLLGVFIGLLIWQYLAWRNIRFVPGPELIKGQRRRKWFLIGLVAPPVLFFLFSVEEDVRGDQEWNRAKQRIQAAGESLDVQAILPHSVPSDQNVAAAPIFTELFATEDLEKTRLGSLVLKPLVGDKHPLFGDFRIGQSPDWAGWQIALTGKKDPATAEQDVLNALQSHNDVLEDLRSALMRPLVCWPVNEGVLLSTKMPQDKAGRSASQFLRLRAMAEIDAKQPEQALEDVSLIFRFSDAIGKGVFLIDYLISCSMDQLAFSAIQHGLEKRVWSIEQIQKIEHLLLSRQPFMQYQRTIRFERCMMFQITNLRPGRGSVYATIPSGWPKSDRAFFVDAMQDEIEAANPTKGTVDFNRVYDADTKAKQCDPKKTFILFRMRRFFSGMTLAPDNSVISKAAQFQAQLNEAIVACALESFRLRNKQLPNSLNELVPEFLTKLPCDPITGDSLKYNPTTDRQDYVLYSIGWNQRDDGGVVDKKDAKQGDWVWASKPELYRVIAN